MQATVLLLDDEASVRQSLGRYLGLYGFGVVHAATLDEALESVRDYVFDAYVLDVRLPGSRSGLDILQFVRGDEASSDRPVIVLTGNVLTEDEEEIIRVHGAYVFYKPHGYGELVGQLRQLCVTAQCA